MERYLTLGYDRRFCDTLQLLSYRAVHAIHPDDTDIPQECLTDDEDRLDIVEHLLASLLGLEPIDDDFIHYLDQLRESISSLDLWELVHNRRTIRLVVDDRGYFLAEEEPS